MERQRSPSYPALSLPQAIEMVEKLHKANRTSIISRETAAKDMGYTGITGRSLTVIAALAQYGLIERAGKGDIKVTRRAVDILHSIDDAARTEAIQDAAYAPKLFAQLHERFPEGIPSQNALRSYLVQQDFADTAIGLAISAFLETNAYAENAKVSESNSDDLWVVPESPRSMMEVQMQAPNIAQNKYALALPISKNAVAYDNGMPDLNKVNMDIRGNQVFVSGLLDAKGLSILEEQISALKILLTIQAKAEDTSEFEPSSH